MTSTQWALHVVTIAGEQLHNRWGCAPEPDSAVAELFLAARDSVTFDCVRDVLPFLILTLDRETVAIIATGRRPVDHAPDHDGVRAELKFLEPRVLRNAKSRIITRWPS